MTKPPIKRGPRRRRVKPAIIATSTIPNKPKAPGAPHVIGYARDSMSDQNNQRQIDALVEYGVWDVDIYLDTGSGKDFDRTGWHDCWRDLETGDMLIVYSLDRLGRNTEEMLRIARELADKGVTIKSLKEDINTSTPTGRLMFTLIAAMAQWEREWNLERTLHGLRMAKERGKIGGRAPDARLAVEIVGPLAERIGTSAAAAELGCSKATVTRRLNEWLATKYERLAAERAAAEKEIKDA